MTLTTLYVYTVTSNEPLHLYTGMGNMPQIHLSPGQGLKIRDRVVTVESNGAAGPGRWISMELTERIENKRDA